MTNTPRIFALYSSAMQSGKTTVADHLICSHFFEAVKFAAPLKAMTEVYLKQEHWLPDNEIHDRVYGHRKEDLLPKHRDLNDYRFNRVVGDMTVALLTSIGLPKANASTRVYGDKDWLLIPGFYGLTTHALKRLVGYFMSRFIYSTDRALTSRVIQQLIGTEFGRQLIHEDVWTDVARLKIQSLLDEGVSTVVDDLRFPNEAEMLQGMGAHLIRIVRPGTTRSNDHASEGLLDDVEMLTLENDGTIDQLWRKVDALVLP